MTIQPISIDQLDYTCSDTEPGGPFGFRSWMWNGQLHSVDDHPALILGDGTNIQWYKYGLRHRDESFGPAWIKNEIETWYNNGQIHRKNGPAMISPLTEKWYCRGELHRDDGPAVIVKYVVKSEQQGSDRGWYWHGMRQSFDSWALNIDPELAVLLKMKYF